MHLCSLQKKKHIEDSPSEHGPQILLFYINIHAHNVGRMYYFVFLHSFDYLINAINYIQTFPLFFKRCRIINFSK